MLQAKAPGHSDNMEVCMLKVWQKRNKAMIWIRSQTVLCKKTNVGTDTPPRRKFKLSIDVLQS